MLDSDFEFKGFVQQLEKGVVSMSFTVEGVNDTVWERNSFYVHADKENAMGVLDELEKMVGKLRSIVGEL